MHELSITESILDIAVKEAKRNNAKSVASIHITIGELSSIVPECVQDYFDLVSEDTVAYKAKLIFTTIPAMIKCSECGRESRLEHFRLRCPDCQSQKVQIISGKEFYVDKMEIEDGE